MIKGRVLARSSYRQIKVWSSLPPSAEEGDAVLRLKDRERGREGGLLEMARGRDDEENENKQISLCGGGDPSLHPFIRMKWWWRVFLSLFPKLYLAAKFSIREFV